VVATCAATAGAPPPSSTAHDGVRGLQAYAETVWRFVGADCYRRVDADPYRSLHLSPHAGRGGRSAAYGAWVDRVCIAVIWRRMAGVLGSASVVARLVDEDCWRSLFIAHGDEGLSGAGNARATSRSRAMRASRRRGFRRGHHLLSGPRIWAGE
jgi:hypothetical protein